MSPSAFIPAPIQSARSRDQQSPQRRLDAMVEAGPLAPASMIARVARRGPVWRDNRGRIGGLIIAWEDIRQPGRPRSSSKY